MASAYQRFMDTGIPAQASAEERRLLRFHRLAVVLLLWVAPVFALIALFMGELLFFALQVITFLMYFVALALTFRGRHTASKVLYNYGVILVVALSYVFIGGANSVYIWFISTLVYAAAVYSASEARAKYLSVGLSLVLFAACAVNNVARGGVPHRWVQPSQALDWTLAVGELGAMLVAGIIVLFLSRSVRLTEAKLENEHRKSERLLLNILPGPIAERLKSKPGVIADGFTQVSVLFSDIVGFTPMSEHLSPRDVVELLNGLFSRFDALVDRYGLEKIKTIGDAYMVAAGLPSPCDDHARRVADLALDMLAEAADFGRQLDPPLGIRIGIHSGPVVAGVIGQSKFAYDLWGDTVNTASRMESEGLVGQIQVSAVTRTLLADGYRFEARGPVEIKGKGLMETFFLLGRAG